MSKKLIFLGIIAIMLSVYGLFQVKYKVQELKRNLIVMHSQIANGKEEIKVLEAEWAYLNNPERLRVLAAKYLGEMEYVKVAQIYDQNAVVTYIASLDNVDNEEEAPSGFASYSSPQIKATLSSYGGN